MPSRRDPDDETAGRRGEDDEGTFGSVFGGEIPDAERAWRRGHETDDEAGVPPEGGIPDSVVWALQGLPDTLREIRAEVRRATDLATDALASRSSGPSDRDVLPEVARAFDPIPAALRELREEIREVVDRANEMLGTTRRTTDAIPSLVATLRAEFDRLTTRLVETLTAANTDAARAFALVAREVRTLGDRHAVLREEVRLLGKKLEEYERLRRQIGRRAPARRPPAAATPPAAASPTPPAE